MLKSLKKEEENKNEEIYIGDEKIDSVSPEIQTEVIDNEYKGQIKDGVEVVDVKSVPSEEKVKKNL